MIKTLSKIQYLQFKRELQNAGIFYSIIFLVILTIIYVVFFNFAKSFYGSLLIPSILILIIFGIHQKRADKVFVLHYLSKPRRNFILEYLLFSFPLLLPLLWSEFPWLIISTVVIIMLISNTKPNRPNVARLLWLSKIISSKNFEWLSGVRKNFYTMLLLLVFAFVLLVFPFAVILPLFFLTNLIISFYQEDEPQHILNLNLTNPGSFLRRKCLNAIIPVVGLYTIPLALAIYFYFEYWYIYLLFLLLQFIAIEFAIFHKYKMYLPNARNNKNEIVLGLVALSCVIPFFLPIPFIFVFREYYLAKKTLKLYTHD